MITGFNTDIEYDGVTYHVQTEDKGLESPIILSLVYSGGAILASKRAPYEDLVASGFSEAALAERLKRQHTLICAAIHAGRIDDLKRMLAQPATRDKEEVEEPAETVAEAPAEKEPILAPPEILLPHLTQSASPPPPASELNEIELTPPPQEYQPVGFKPRIQAAGSPPAPPKKAPEVKKAAEPKASEPKKVPEPGEAGEPRTGSESTTLPIPGKPASEKTIPIPNRAGGAKAVPPPKVAESKPVSPRVAAEKTPAPPVTSAAGPVGDVYTVHDSRRKSPLGDLPAGEQRLIVSLLEDRDFRAGESLIVRLMVLESSKIGSRPLPNASISLKILGTAFRPQIYTTKTGPDGVATIAADIPIFTTGRAAILIRASALGQSTEIRRLVHPRR